jgi:site-specific DNA recombinase
VIVALYARVSSDRQKETETISSQVQELQEFAAGEGLAIDERHIYCDEGESGYYLDRPALDRLRDAARDGLIDALLVQNPDRLARRYAYQVLLLEEFKRWKVAVRFLKQPPPESPEQKLLVQIQGVISEYERARIMERTRRGRLYWARQGRPVCSHVPFGYRYIPRNRDEPPSLEVDEEAAPIVREIFQWYVSEGLNIRHIASRLTDRKVPPPKGDISYWDPSTVSFILKNEAYLGRWYLNRFKREPGSAQKRPRNIRRSREEWIPIPVHPLLSPEDFMKAQQIRESGRHGGAKPLRYPETHLLRRLVECGACGRKMTAHNHSSGEFRYYWCRGPDTRRFLPLNSRCPHATVSAPPLDDLVWSDVVSLLTDPQLLLTAWKEQNRMSENQGLSREEIRRLKRQMIDADTQRQRLLDAYQEGAIELEELTARRRVIDEKTEKIQMNLDGFSRIDKEELSFADLGENIHQVCQSLANGLNSMGMKERMGLAQKLIEKVVVEKQDVKIHYRFPVSSHFNKKRERADVLLPHPRICGVDEYAECQGVAVGELTAFQGFTVLTGAIYFAYSSQ